ncbi:odorant receptor 9a-like [Colletes latitarsis]|uniref:odorant receptor 9a-like n=1 Tax=Colletes latitarsis TaxID=2605962 RepID=UPI004035A35A
MESSQYEYLRVNKYFLRVIGQWPYQSTLEKILIGIVFIPIIALQTIIQGGGMITALNVGDIDSFMEGFSPFIISWMCLAKFTNFIFNGSQMKNLLNMMRDDWKMFSVSSNDLDILSRHYGVGKKITFNYAASLYGTMTPFMIVPSLQIAADAVGFYNLSGERPLMFRIEHFVDTEKYYYFMLIHSYFGTLAFITVVVACDSMIVLYVQHECGICEILGGRLKNFVDGDTNDIELYPNKHEDKPYQNTRSCIILHKHIIEFGKTIEDANTVALFFQLGFNLMGVSFTQFQAIANLATPNKSLRFGSFTICLLSILFLDSWRGQQMLDSTNRIFEYTTSGNWYYSSLNSRKLLSVMLSKSMRPIKVTAGKLYILNLENFTSVLRTSFSYCMVLCSFQ